MSIFTGTAVVFIPRAFGAIMQFAFHLIIARYIGIEGFGLYSLALTFSIVSSVIARWGSDQWIARELPAAIVGMKTRTFESVFFSALILVVTLSIAVVGSLLLTSSYILEFFIIDYNDNKYIFKLMILSIIPFSLTNFFSEAFRAVEKHFLATFLQSFLIPFISIIIVFWLLFSSGSLVLKDVAFSYLLATFIAMMWGVLYIKTILSKYKTKQKFEFLKLPLIKESSEIAIIVFFSTWLSYADLLILSYFHNPSEVGIFAAAQRIVLIFSLFLLTLNSILSPRFSALNQQKNLTELYSFYKRARNLMIFVGVPSLIIIGIFSQSILSLFGSDFIDSENVLLVLLLGCLFNVMMGPVALLMMMTRHTEKLKKYTFITVVIHVCISFILIPKYGALGAAISVNFVVLLLNGLCWYYVESLCRANMVRQA